MLGGLHRGEMIQQIGGDTIVEEDMMMAPICSKNEIETVKYNAPKNAKNEYYYLE